MFFGLLVLKKGVAENHAYTSGWVDFNGIEENSGGFVVVDCFPCFSAIGGFDYNCAIAHAHGHGNLIVDCPDVAIIFVRIGCCQGVEMQFVGGIVLPSEDSGLCAADPYGVVWGGAQSSVVWGFVIGLSLCFLRDGREAGQHRQEENLFQ